MTTWRQPRKLQSTGKWHYTESNTSNTWCFPLGYCAERNCQHDTPEEAVACYMEYRLDHEIQIGLTSDCKKKCLVCEAWTQNRALFGNHFCKEFVLCEDHCNREQIKKLVKNNERS